MRRYTFFEERGFLLREFHWVFLLEMMGEEGLLEEWG